MSFEVVTGAFSFTGRAIARRLLDDGRRVRTLTNHPAHDPFQGSVEHAPLDFTDPGGLVASLKGARTLYNTYWVRYAHGPATYEQAVGNTATLVWAAAQAGVQRIVHIGITRPSEGSPYAYFRGKARAEAVVREAGLPFGIVRPTVVFGRGDVLLNNIAWLVRRFPVFAVPAPGRFSLQPVAVDDVARICVEAADADGNVVWDAAGPEVLGFADLVRLVIDATGARCRLVPAPVGIASAIARMIGALRRDILLQRWELEGLADGLVVSDEPPRGVVGLSDWLAADAHELGRDYVSELSRHYALL